MISNSLQFGMDRVSSPKSVDISAMPAIPNILRNTMRGIIMSCKRQKCPLLTVSLIRLTQRRYAIVDVKNYHWLNQWKWFANTDKRQCVYARRLGGTGGKPYLAMHRLIARVRSGEIADHINRNTLDNREINLRKCSLSQNSSNRKKYANTSSKYKGVHWHKGHKKWSSEVRSKGVRYRLGDFKSEIEAAKAYDEKVVDVFGEFANLNFPESEKSNV